jgi:hypothetical protein
MKALSLAFPLPLFARLPPALQTCTKAITLPLFELLRGFAAATGAKVMLGEWTLARLGSRAGLDAAAARYYYEETSAFLGRCVWNFDGPGAWRAAAPAHPTHPNNPDQP